MFIRDIRIDRAGLEAAGSYVSSLPFVRHLAGDTIPLTAPVTFFVGENGSGKSTLLEAIAAAAGMNPEGGGSNFSFSTRESHSDLCQYMTLVRNAGKRWKDSYFLRAESFFNVATQIEEMDRLPGPSRKLIESYGGRSLHEQSHGESFFSLLLNRFGGSGLYILDEPEAALSPARQIAMLHLIRDLVEKGSQFLISTHSPILTALPGASVYEFRETGLTEVRWEETENYILTKRFLSSPSYFLEED
ncbi:MAG: AAA family ATPase [Clostridia bacterium]|nr:AAA family ATPase [Clostridia bacterium]